jgi:hypothetical protein
MRYWKVTCQNMTEKLNDWSKARIRGDKALVKLRKSIAADEIGITHGWFCGVPQRIGFKFSGKPDSAFFTKPDQDGYSLIKASAKTLRQMQADAISLYESYEPISALLGIKAKQFHGLRLWAPQFFSTGGVWYFATADNYDGNSKAERVSDVEIDRLFPRKKRTGRIKSA